VHWEYDFSEIATQEAETELQLHSDQCTLSVIRDEKYKYVHFTAQAPLFFDLQKDPGQFTNVAADPAYASRVLDYAQKMLSWRMEHDERTLTRLFLTSKGVVERRRDA
jgi:arylsulfatase A-like enzyme